MPASTPKKPRPRVLMPGMIRVGPLKTMAQIQNELARVYRAARRGDLPIEDGTRLASILRIMIEAIRA